MLAVVVRRFGGSSSGFGGSSSGFGFRGSGGSESVRTRVFGGFESEFVSGGTEVMNRAVDSWVERF